VLIRTASHLSLLSERRLSCLRGSHSSAGGSPFSASASQSSHAFWASAGTPPTAFLICSSPCRPRFSCPIPAVPDTPPPHRASPTQRVQPLDLALVLLHQPLVDRQRLLVLPQLEPALRRHERHPHPLLRRQVVLPLRRLQMDVQSREFLRRLDQPAAVLLHQ